MAELAPPRIERIRHELVRRRLTVAHTERLTPRMLRITLTGPDLAGFVSPGFDDHLKLLLPGDDAGPARRDYTPRRFDAAQQELVIDFALHDAGPATLWALQTRPGDQIEIGGPRGSQVIGGVRQWLLIGDETALPAIGRKIEETPPDQPLTALIAVAGAEEEQAFPPRPGLMLHWLHRAPARADDATALLAALGRMPIAPGTFVWLAGEASVARALRAHLLNVRNHPPGWLRAKGYWQRGQADTVEDFEGA